MNRFVKFLALLLVGITTAAHAQTGNVGIGTTNPNAKLHVNGDLRVDGLPSVTNATKRVVIHPTTGKFATEPRPNPLVRIHAQTGGNSIPAGGSRKITWSTTLVNTVSSAWNPSTGEFTAPRAGLYEVSASLLYGVFSADEREFNVQIRKNNAGYALSGNFTGNSSGNNYKPTSTAHAVVALASGDKITVWTYQNSGASRSLHTNTTWNWVNIIELAD